MSTTGNRRLDAMLKALIDSKLGGGYRCSGLLYGALYKGGYLSYDNNEDCD